MYSVAHSRYVEKMSSSLIYRFKTCPSSNNAEWGSLSIAHTAVIDTDSCWFFILLWKDSSVLWNRQQVQVSKWLAFFTNTASSKAEFVASSKLTLYEAKEKLYFLSLIVYFGIGEKGNIEQHMFFLQCPTVFLRFIHPVKKTFFFL